MITLFLFGNTTYASGPRFWVEPLISYTTQSSLNDEVEKGSATGSGGGLQLFGFFSQNFYFGIQGRYDSLSFEMDEGSAISDVSATAISAGPLLGLFFNRIRLWASYLILDEFSQTYVESAINYESKMSGSGYLVGAGFWMWPHMLIGVEYLDHSFNEFEQLLPTQSSGDLTNELHVNQLTFNLHFPFEL